MTARKASSHPTVDCGTARTPVLALAAKNERSATTSRSARQTPSFAVEHRPLAPPPRLAKPQPRPEPEPKPAVTPPFEAGLERLGQTWVIIKRDACGKRAVARCCACLSVREIGLADDTIARCGCSGTSPGAGRFAAPASTFASGVSGAARFEARGRHRGRT